MTNEEINELELSIDQMMSIAKGFGLDFYDMRFEICPADIIYTFGAYGMPTRFSHWSFGKSFHRMKMSYDFGLSRIYELVINSDPCYAFLLDGNTLIQNKMVSAHVLAHCDFFKNNARFRNTKRNMVDSMSSAAERIREYEFQHGKLKVEQFLDDCLAISEHIDPALIRNPREELESRMGRNGALTIQQPESLSNPNGVGQTRTGTRYDDLWSLDERTTSSGSKEEMNRSLKAPKNPAKDLLYFLMQHSHILEEWQCDVLSIIRDEMLYFWPQIETKIMNEGWATFWHLRIMREMEMTSDEAIEFAKLHSGVVVPSRTSINPYHIGLHMWEDLEKRVGVEGMFEIREYDSDISFLRNYLTQELCEDMDLFIFQKKGNEWKVTENAWESVRDQLCTSKVNGGFPVIVVEDGDYLSSGELYLKHLYEGVELDVKYLEKTIPHVYNLWGKTVHLQTILENRPVLFTYDGKKNHRKFM